MDIAVLGPLDVTENGLSVTPTAPKPREVLALLALHADQVVPVSALIEELWGQRPPRSARTTLQTYVLQLRALISAAITDPEEARPGTAKQVLVTTPAGYVLDTSGGTSDVCEFEHLAGTGHRALDALRDALGLWTGSAFSDIQTGLRLTLEGRRLEATRLCALDQRIEDFARAARQADLRLRRHRELLGELTLLVSRHRTHENLDGQLLLALHRSGRRSEALGVYQRLRTALIRELALEPSPALRRIQRYVLLAGPEPAAVGAAAGSAGHLSADGVKPSPHP
uniref:Pathway-specific regulatory protein TylS n=1 Tax=Streptomyces fradiae TaxID=1906 RepID=M4ML56_STRFR|nr:pathway-specific regulatory protein TylS [Streptomyces fradiae]